MGFRFYDSIKNNSKIGYNADFVVREKMPVWKIFGIMVFVIAAVLFGLSFIVSSIAALSKIVFFIAVGFGSYGIFYLQNNRDLTLNSEFLNTILSSALAQSSKFCLIMRTDGTITYFNSALQELFPNFLVEKRRSIDVLVGHLQISNEQRKEVFEAFENGLTKKIILDVVDSNNQKHILIMMMEPLVKPKGFMIMCGYEFVEKRTEENFASYGSFLSLFNKANFDLLSYITNSIGVGVYIADIHGNISYINPILVRQLNYRENEVINFGNVSIKDLILHDEPESLGIGMQNFEGEIKLRGRIGGIVGAFLNQKLIYDEKGENVGCAAFVHILDDSKTISANKRNNW